jgi:hypothetical protein
VNVDIEILRRFLAWCVVFNWVSLALWWLILKTAGDWVYGVHSRWAVEIPRQSFDTIHYAGMALYKMVIFVFALVPYLVLRLCF